MSDDKRVICRDCGEEILYNEMTRRWEADLELGTICMEKGFKENSIHVPEGTAEPPKSSGSVMHPWFQPRPTS